MTYEEARKYLEDCNQYAGELTLEPLREMLRRLGDPQDGLSFVHIAGTNGKGSVLAYVSTVLKEAGYRVGRYISPTIFSYRERIQVNEQYISREDLVRLTERIKRTGDQMLAEGLPHPTMFEAETALAFLYFAEQKCDLVVLECGMGGRTDATNVIRSTVAAVLASISMDHMGFLGATVQEIAGNKAGIIKPGCKVVALKQKPEAERMILKQAGACGCPVVTADPECVVNRKRGLFLQTFDYKEREKMEITLSGEHQFENAALALEVIDVLKEKGYTVSEEAVRAGFRRTVWTGRFSVVAQEPYFIVDGAHNRDAAEKLAGSIENYLQGKRLIYIMGVLADKEYDAVIEKTAGYASEIITVMTPDNVRALPAEELAKAVTAYNPHVQAAESIEAAVNRAYELAGKDDVILAFGSLSWMGELVRTVQNHGADRDGASDINSDTEERGK
ncbi:MAG: bifunctional folylpolyglutamate synthase/dihydrofolate synthase [Lachnospiraceae bacterium]|nr:bifunctional folylpolyglutamate synthase/dihydrofolate synthase [Lachnospiraceae bacterium]